MLFDTYDKHKNKFYKILLYISMCNCLYCIFNFGPMIFFYILFKIITYAKSALKRLSY